MLSQMEGFVSFFLMAYPPLHAQTCSVMMLKEKHLFLRHNFFYLN